MITLSNNSGIKVLLFIFVVEITKMVVAISLPYAKERYQAIFFGIPIT